jgi:hypothetical protein
LEEPTLGCRELSYLRSCEGRGQQRDREEDLQVYEAVVL